VSEGFYPSKVGTDPRHGLREGIWFHITWIQSHIICFFFQF